LAKVGTCAIFGTLNHPPLEEYIDGFAAVIGLRAMSTEQTHQPLGKDAVQQCSDGGHVKPKAPHARNGKCGAVCVECRENQVPSVGSIDKFDGAVLLAYLAKEQHIRRCA
jgi:hypothetical protein